MDAQTLIAATWATSRERLLSARARGEGETMSDPNAQLEALARAVQALAEVQIPHALIGGLAVGLVSGVPRATLDVDLAVPSTVERAALTAALLAGGFVLVGDHAHSFNFRHPGGEPVQLAMDPAFDPMIRRAIPLQVGDVEVRVVTREDLIAMKQRAAADPALRRSKALRDQADVALLLGDVPDPDEGW